MPFAELKLNRNFVQNCSTDKARASLCESAVALAHRFGSLAVAGGIEKAGDLVAITRTGCDIAQGFIFAHAMPKEFLISASVPTATHSSQLRCQARPEPGHTIPA